MGLRTNLYNIGDRPQGTVLGPLLFLVFINDLPDNILSRVRLFADDCILYREIRTTQDCHTLQIDLNIFVKVGRCMGNGIRNVIACSRSTRPVHQDYHLKGTVLTHCTSSKYLGVDMSSDLSWNTLLCRLEPIHRQRYKETSVDATSPTVGIAGVQEMEMPANHIL